MENCRENDLEQVETNGAGTRETKKRGNFFTTKKIVLIALFTALSYVVSFLEIPLPLFGASFLKLDFGNVFIVLIGFLLGPIEGVITCFLKEGLRCLSSSSLCAGELANFIITSAYLLLPSVVYTYKKNLKTVLFLKQKSQPRKAIAVDFRFSPLPPIAKRIPKPFSKGFEDS